MVLLPLRRIWNDGPGDIKLQCTMTVTMAVQISLVLQPHHEFETSDTPACRIYK